MPQTKTASPTRAGLSGRRTRRVSLAGLSFIVVGVLMVAAEWRTNLGLRRLGLVGHWAIFICGGYFILWGLTETIAGLWPKLGAGRYRFSFPLEGRIFLLIIIVLFLGSLLGRSNTLLLVFCCLAGPFVINGPFIIKMLNRLNVTRKAPPRVMAGECFSVEVTLKNGKRFLPVWMMTVRDRLEFFDGSLDPEVLFLNVARRASQSASYRACVAARGRVRFGPVILQSRFPLGIVERGEQVKLDGDLLVYPRLGRLAPNWRKLIETTRDASLSAAQVTHSSDTFHRLRDYHSGDDPRTIHWRTSARRGDLMVREFRDERDSPVVLLLDLWEPPEGADDRIELALSFAATVCVQQRRSDRAAPVACAAAGDQWMDWNGSFRGDPIESLLDSLALISSSSRADWKGLLDFAGRTLDRRQTVLLMTCRSPEVTEELPRVLSERGLERLGSSSIRVMEMADLKSSRVFHWT